MGSGCSSVGRAVASNTRGPRFESRHRQIFMEHLFTVNCIVLKRRKKEAGNGPFFNFFGHLTGFEPRTPGIGIDRSTNWVTSTAPTLFCLYSESFLTFLTLFTSPIFRFLMLRIFPNTLSLSLLHSSTISFYRKHSPLGKYHCTYISAQYFTIVNYNSRVVIWANL